MSIPKGSRIVFQHEETVLEGKYVKRVYPYYLVETGTSCWRVLIQNIISVDGKPELSFYLDKCIPSESYLSEKGLVGATNRERLLFAVYDGRI
jgi:hypothetical protein